jgi:dUTP pyrophosphatase
MGMGDQQQCPEILHQPGVIHQLSTYDNTGTKGVARILNHRRIHPLSIPTVRVHVDGGANRSITNDSGHLLSYRNIKKYPMAGVAAGEAALTCTGVGYLPWQADTGEVVLVRCFYSPEAADTILSPTDIVVNNIHDYEAWEQYSHIDTGKGYIKFHRRGNNPDITFNLSSSNGLWFHTNVNASSDFSDWHSKPVINRLHRAAEYTLYHFRYGCAGKRNMSIIHMHVDNQPKLQQHCFFNCLACMLATGDQRAATSDDNNVQTATFDDCFDDNSDDASVSCDPGQHFHVDFGFMKGSGYCKKDEEGRTITSIDGFRSYFLVIDRKTRYVWVFLTKSKKPPLTIFAQFLKEHGHPSASNRTVRSDRGGELWGSQAFRDIVQQAGYIMDPTAPKAAFQNAKAERPNRNLAKTVRCLLYNANLGPEYWSFALLHAVYLKNRLPHCTTNQVPLTAYTGKRPNAKRLRVFGCPVVVRHMDRKAKLDLNTTAGIFLGYTATDKNVIYRDSVTGRFKTATHVLFDEAGMTLPAADRNPAAKVLQELGYGTTQVDYMDEQTEQEPNDVSTGESCTTSLPQVPLTQESQPPHPDVLSKSGNSLKVKCLSLNATLPTRATDGSVGYDVFSAVDLILQPKTRSAVPLDIALTPPTGTYAQLKSRSGLSLKHSIDVQAGTIDRDYTGNIQVVLYNSGDAPYGIKIGDRIAQLVLLQIQTPAIEQIDVLTNTIRGEQGFGSTGKTV